MDSITFLERFYNKLHDNLIKKYKKEKNRSILIWFFDIKSNDRFRLLKDSSIQKIKIPTEALNKLLSNKLIRETDTVGEYVITAQGIWSIEKEKGILSEEVLLDNFDVKFFNLYSASEKPVSEKHKILLFSMIAARSFSEQSSVDLKKKNITLDAWEDIITKSYEFLREMDIITKLNKDMLFGKKGNEHKVSNVFRHTDSLPKQSKGIFKAIGCQKYYIDLYREGEISIENLRYLFKQIFGEKKLSVIERDNICNFCDQISTSKNIYLFDIECHLFHDPEYDLVIRDALLAL